MIEQLSFLDSLAVLLVFLVLHVFVGAVLPFRPAHRPFLQQMLYSAGQEIERRLNREGRAGADLFVRGAVVVFIVSVFALVIGAAARKIAGYPFGWCADVALLFACVSTLSPIKAMHAVLKELAVDRLPAARSIIQPYFEEDLGKSDAHTVIRRTIEYGGTSMLGGFVLPVFFYLLFGQLGLVLSVTAVALDGAFGSFVPNRVHFGAVLRGIYGLVAWAPARVTAILIAGSAVFVSRGKPAGAVQAWLRLKKYTPLNHGIIYAALAGALGVTLGGPVKVGNLFTIENSWIENKGASARAGVDDLKRAAMLLFAGYLCVIAALSAFYIWENNFS